MMTLSAYNQHIFWPFINYGDRILRIFAPFHVSRIVDIWLTQHSLWTTLLLNVSWYINIYFSDTYSAIKQKLNPFESDLKIANRNVWMSLFCLQKEEKHVFHFFIFLKMKSYSLNFFKNQKNTFYDSGFRFEWTKIQNRKSKLSA